MAERGATPVREVLLERGLWQVSTVSPGTTVLEALSTMEERGLGALMVTDDECLVGIITAGDCSRRVLLEGRDPGRTFVSAVMSGATWSVNANREVWECIALMLRRGVQHLPVLFGCCLVGCVSLRDLMGHLCGCYPGKDSPAEEMGLEPERLRLP
jgi:CBS domain-containing protein